MPSDEVLGISSHHQGKDRTVIVLSGELDLDGAPRVTATVLRVLEESRPILEIDARSLSFMDSAGLQTLLKAREAVLGAGAMFQVSGVSGAVERAIGLAGIGDELLGPGS